MATSTDSPIPTAKLDGAVAPYSRDMVYVKTAVLLGVITLVEIATHVWPGFVLWSWGSESNVGVIVTLLLLMIVKFAIVVGVFMHLKYDKPILWRVFASGLVLAMAVYLGMMLMFRMFLQGEAPL